MNNIIVEGISDYYYIRSAIVLLKYHKLDDAMIVPSVGATKIPQLVSLCLGWNLNFVAVFDNDKEGTKVAKELIKILRIDENKVIFSSDRTRSCIEDLFDHSDFNNHVLHDPDNGIPEATVISTYLKEYKVDKVLISKSFFEKVQDTGIQIQLHKKTITSFTNLLNKISSGLN